MTNAVKKNWGEGDIADQTGKTVFITGANIGLGFEATRMLSSRGARVLVNDCGTGVMRHADAGYESAIAHARATGMNLPGITDRP